MWRETVIVHAASVNTWMWAFSLFDVIVSGGPSLVFTVARGCGSRGKHLPHYFFVVPAIEMGQLHIPVNPQRSQETCVWPWRHTTPLDEFTQHLDITAILLYCSNCGSNTTVTAFLYLHS